MTDNEIIKALERMSEEDADGFSNDILNFINRQYAEIDNLNCVIVSAEQQIKLASSVVDRQKAEIERLKTEKDNLIKTYAECQIDFLKEFVKEHKEIMYAFTNENLDFEMKWAEYEANTDNLVKEMVGGR